jgi:ectoine hydroxylase-related dioxygenase (phytanoyl-CoA dioxygenase family)
MSVSRPGIDRDGFVLIGRLLCDDRIHSLRAACEAVPRDSANRRAGVRDLLRNVPEVRALAESPPVRAAVEPVLHAGAFVTRAILFDKTSDSNWSIPWHQDTAIAVQQRLDVPGFGPWSIKGDVHQVQPPAQVLVGMVTLRVHLDECGEENAPLLVLPGSHREGLLTEEQIAKWKGSVRPVACTTGAGGAVLMRPLLLHSSLKAERPGRRRVVHLEFASGPLPG